MFSWRTIKTFEALKEFSLAFAEAPLHEQTTIKLEMEEYLAECEARLAKIKAIMPPQAEKTVLRVKRRGKRRS